MILMDYCFDRLVEYSAVLESAYQSIGPAVHCSAVKTLTFNVQLFCSCLIFSLFRATALSTAKENELLTAIAITHSCKVRNRSMQSGTREAQFANPFGYSEFSLSKPASIGELNSCWAFHSTCVRLEFRKRLGTTQLHNVNNLDFETHYLHEWNACT